MNNVFKSCILLLLILGSIPMARAADQSSETTISGMPIFLDTRLMVLAHPLYKAFDIKSRRFKGTSSESFEEDFSSREDFVQKIKDTEDELLKYPEKLKEKLKKIPFKDRFNAERELILAKKQKEAKLESMKRRFYLSRLVPTKDGLTPYMSIYPQCRDLADAINNVISQLKRKYKTEIVIDIANILPFKDKLTTRQFELNANLIKDAYKKDCNVSAEELSQWMDVAKNFWAANQGMNANIIPVGAKDVRLEAIKLLEEDGKGYKLWDWQK